MKFHYFLLIALASAILAAILLPAYLYAHHKACANRWDAFYTSYEPFKGCMIKVDGGWVHERHFKGEE